MHEYILEVVVDQWVLCAFQCSDASDISLA